MEIGKVILRNYGLKGLQVSFMESDGKGDTVEKVHTYRRPVGVNMRGYIKDIEAFANQFFALDPKRRNVISLNGIMVRSVNDQNEYRMNINYEPDYGGNINVWTGWIKEGVKSYESVADAIDALCDEVEKYCKRQRADDDKQVIMDFAIYEKKDKVREAAAKFVELMDGKSPEELHAAARSLCEGHGDFILSNDKEEEVEAESTDEFEN